MVELPPQGASDTYGQLPDTGADTIRAPRHGFARLPFTVKRMSMGKLIPGRLAGGRAAELVGGGPTVPHCEKCANTFFRYGHFWSSGKWNPPLRDSRYDARWHTPVWGRENTAMC